MAITIKGNWKIRVKSKDADWDQRFVISDSTASKGTYPGVVGTQVEADGAKWKIQVQAYNEGSWLDSEMRIGPETPYGISTTRVIETNDQGEGDKDYNDLVIEIRKKLDPIIEIVQRPSAINPETLMMNPDGVFLAGSLQIMAVRVRNTWTKAMPADQAINISTLGRMQLMAAGIQVIDSWSNEELAAFSQTMAIDGLMHMPITGPLPVGGERTVYFKLDCRAARVGTPSDRLICIRPVPEPDRDDPARLAHRKIFVTQVRYSAATHEVIAEAPEGRFRLRPPKVILDPRLYNHARNCIRRSARGPRDSHLFEFKDQLTHMLTELEAGRCDPCALQRLLMALLCECLVTHGGDDGHGKPDWRGGVNPCPFPWLPIQFTYIVEAPFDGQYGPLPFQDPPWKILAAILALLLAIAAALVDIFDEAHKNPDIVIGYVDRFSTDNVDAVLIKLKGERGIDLGILDAQSGEPYVNARLGIDGVIPIVRSVASPFVGMQVYKSGARTGLTHGIITHIDVTMDQCRGEWEDATQKCLPETNPPHLTMYHQIRIAPNPAYPGEPTTDHGDSGSLWLSDEPATRDQVVGLTHSGNITSDANPIGEVLQKMKIRLNPSGGP